MQGDAYLKCVNPKCGLEYPIMSTNVQCENGHVLDVIYKINHHQISKKHFMKEEIPREIFLMKVVFGDFEIY